MSFKSFVADQFHESSVKLLFINTKLLAKEILNDDELDEAKGIARKGSQAKQKGARWVFINQLIETRIDADNQIGVLRRCTSKVDQAIELELGEEDLENFLKLFSVRLAEDIEDLEGLREALKGAGDNGKISWITSAEKRCGYWFPMRSSGLMI